VSAKTTQQQWQHPLLREEFISDRLYYSSNDGNETKDNNVHDDSDEKRIMGIYDLTAIVLDDSNDTGGFFIERAV